MRGPSRSGVIHAALLIFATVLVGRAAQIQLVEGEEWAEKARRQHFRQGELPASRGAFRDVRGEPLVESWERLRLSIAPREVADRDREALAAVLARAGIAPEWRERALDRSRKWVDLPGRFLPVDVAGALSMRGVYAGSSTERVHFGSRGIQTLIGRVDAEGVAQDGLELILDSRLRGRSGEATFVRDVAGRRREQVTATHSAPAAGNSVTLTINRELQDITERALADAVDALGARGGDIVVMEPASGEILALASYNAGSGFASSAALTDAYEPGSTVKPLLAARLLALGRVGARDTVDTGTGRFVTATGRVITDDHPEGALTLADVIRVSSNIGMVRFAERMTPAEQYEAYRDAGFGMPTGIPYPSEAAGQLPAPRQWSQLSAASLAMGYELTVTSVQLAAAYAAVANGGELMEPALVKEIRTADGTVMFSHRPVVVRRVMSPPVAAHVRSMLRDVVADGTGRSASLNPGGLAGKTGTARLAVNGRYSATQHIATFAGMFPVERPQYVILVKLVAPRGSYASRTAAPLARIVLEAAIASRDASLDRRALASAPAIRPHDDGAGDAIPAGRHEEAGSAPYVIAIDAPVAAIVTTGSGARAVPAVEGLPLRSAVYMLHRAGFRVQLDGNTTGSPRRTEPAAGEMSPPGTTVRLFNR